MTMSRSGTRKLRRSVTKGADLAAIKAMPAPARAGALLSSTTLVAGLFAGLGGMVAMTTPAMADCVLTGSILECSGTDADGYSNTTLTVPNLTGVVHDGATVNNGINLGNNGANTVNIEVTLQGKDTFDPAVVNGTSTHALNIVTENGSGAGNVIVTTGVGTSLTGGSTGSGYDGLRIRSGGTITLNLSGNVTAGNGTQGEIIDAQSSVGGVVIVNLNAGTYTAHQSDGIVVGSAGGAVEVNVKNGVEITGGNSSDDYSLWIVSSNDAEIDFDGKIRNTSGLGGNGIHVGVGVGGGSAEDVEITLGENADVLVDGVGVYVDASGDVKISNVGTVAGGAYGIEVTNAESVVVGNASYNSVIGGKSGEYIHDVGQVTVYNGGGFTIGLGNEGVRIEDVAGFWSDGFAGTASVRVYNGGFYDAVEDKQYGGGIIAGRWDGVQISYVGQGSVIVNNSGYKNGERLISGGLIAGVGGDGVDISDIDDNVIIYNDNTRAEFSGIDFADVFDAGTLADIQLWLPNGYLDGDLQLPGGYTTGIWGADDGVVIEYVGDLAFIGNGAGLIVGLEGNGISLNDVQGRSVDPTDYDGESRVAFAIYNGASELSELGGIIWGGDDGIDLYDLDGSAIIWNEEGTIFGGDDGIDIYDIWNGNVVIANAEGGLIQGLRGDAITVGDVSSHWSTGYGGGVEIRNGGRIFGGDSAISVDGAETVEIINWDTGAIVGDGSWSQPVIDLEDVDGAADDAPAAYIDNNGVIASRALPQVTNANTWSLPSATSTYDPQLDVAALRADLNSLEDFFWDGGSLDLSVALADYADAAGDRAIRARFGGATAVDNDFQGVLVGRVNLDGANGDVSNSITNDGFWLVTGYNSLTGSSEDHINNRETGFIQTAFVSGDTENTTFRTNRFDNLGVISLIDGGTGDRTTIRGDYAGGGDVGLDLDLDDLTADLLRLRNGSVEGETGLVFRLIGQGGGAYGDEIDVVDYSFDDTEETAFFISSASDNYIEIGGTPMIQDGFLGWYLVQDTDWEDFELVAGWGPGAVNAPSIISGAQNIWYDTYDVVEDHIYGSQFASAGGGGADLIVPWVPDAPNPVPSAGVWIKGTGSWTEREAELVDSGITYDTSSEQKTAAVLAGVDFKPEGTDLRLGLFGGYVASGLEFVLPGTSVEYAGGVIGGYAAYNDGAFYADITAKADLLGATYNFAGTSAETTVTSYGVAANTGYRFDAGSAFIEPLASFAYVLTRADDITDGNGTISFDDATSLRAGAGVKVGTSFTSGDFVTELSLLGRIWNEFAGDNTVTVNYGPDNYTITDSTGGVFGELAATATVQSADGGLSGFLSGTGKFGESFTSYGAEVGFRVGF